MITVQEMMSPDPKTLSRFNSLADARKLMEENRFRHIPIVNDNRELIGLVTQRNVFASSISAQELIDKEDLSRIESGTLLADIMSTDLTTVTTNVKVSDAAHLIHKKKFGCLPVVNHEYRLVGIITDHDFVAITIQLLDIMEQGEPMELDDE